ncbi:uncharacterized protein BKA78DRAFT_158295 [Phyllosticta capitalensis]|uniref:uncharacterized protein n=1 Tax=Phyllosticta capitalensis TaxID=121624 RepID=UPI00312F29AD
MSEVSKAAPKLERAIAESHFLSLDAFNQLWDATEQSDVAQRSPAWLQGLSEEYDRYQLWAGNLGAGNSNYKLSLDYRLEDASFYRNRVLSLLKILRRHIGRALHVMGEHDLSAQLCCDSDDSQIGVEEDESSLGDLSDSENYVSNDRRAEDPRLIQQKELDSLLGSVKLAINCLFQLPIRKPAPVDRLRHRSAKYMKTFEKFDILYVRDKFPLLHPRVASKLGEMVTRRRQLLLYRESHATHLKGSRSIQNHHVQARKHSPQDTKEPSFQLDVTRSATGNSSRTGGSKSEGKSEATKFAPGPLHAEQESLKAQLDTDAESTTSDQASDFTRDQPAQAPPRPRNENGQPLISFECRYCRLIVLKHSDKDWKKHVLEDLQPYVCTFPDCELSEHLFENRDAWFKHEMQKHRIEFFCNVEGHKSYEKRAEFLEHLCKEHGTTNEIASTLPELFRRPSALLSSHCNLCGQRSNGLKAHVSRHLQHIALFAIPRAHYHSDLDAEEDDSNIAQQIGTDGLSGENIEHKSLYSDGEAYEAARASRTGLRHDRPVEYHENGRVDAPYPQPVHAPQPPQWLVEALQDLRKRHESSLFKAFMQYCAIEKDTGAQVRLDTLPTGAHLSPNLKFMWIPRIRCLDCSDTVYPPGPGLTAKAFGKHLENWAHCDAVDERKERISTWLSSSEHDQDIHEMASERFLEGSCQWFFKNERFTSWMNMQTQRLWCFGARELPIQIFAHSADTTVHLLAGVGKTCLA